ncbi:hypothetical protein GTW51_22475 [Aurantimonas aggregata]|uniref:Uncharacterized protein n=1 Tax=Aurantimonas aggregata TaxID=2047720 RepID=A0A6L9MND9_9HYPH|nr:hypothetical protein [Aurantimonas aggregata]NDV89419.1 hypothetical protein [Aurantimonas aggregata]
MRCEFIHGLHRELSIIERRAVADANAELGQAVFLRDAEALGRSLAGYAPMRTLLWTEMSKPERARET